MVAATSESPVAMPSSLGLWHRHQVVSHQFGEGQTDTTPCFKGVAQGAVLTVLRKLTLNLWPEEQSRVSHGANSIPLDRALFSLRSGRACPR